MTDAERQRPRDGPRQRPGGRIPRLPPVLVPRPRLHAALDRGSRTPLTLVISPAGTGKTVLLSSWAARQLAAGQPVVWAPAQEPDLVSEIVARAGTGDAPAASGVVVVDDAGLLPEATLAALSQLLTKTPRTIRLLLAARHDLPLPVPELELLGLASTLRFRDLRFTDAEATELIHGYAENATTADVRTLQQQTGGWAAALVLAARRTATAAQPSVATIATERPVLELLIGEMFRTLDEQVRAVLVSTFEATAVTGRVAVVLSGDPDAEAILAELADTGLLVSLYAGESATEPVYRHHQLLVELLKRRTADNAAEARLVVAAHLRAALYFENRGEGGDALRHALGADDPELVARVLLAHGPGLLATGAADLVTSGFDALPDGHLDEHPQLLGLRGLLRRRTGDVTGAVMDAASGASAVAAANPATATPDDDALEADTLILRLWESRYGWHDIRDAIGRARAAVGSGPEAVDERRVVLGPDRLCWLLIELAATETWAGELDDALRHLDEALVTARLAGHPQLTGGSLAHRAIVQYARGQVQNAARSAQAALDVSGAHGLPEEYAVRAHVVLGFVALNHLDTEAAQDWYRMVATADIAGSDTVVVALRDILRAVLLIEAGRIDEARTELATDPASAGPLPSYLIRDLALLRFRLAVPAGDRNGVERQVAVLDRTGHEAEADLLRAIDSIALGDAEATLRAIDAAIARPGIHPVLAAAAAAFRTVLLLRLGDEEAAEAALVDTLHRIAPQRTLHALTPVSQEPGFLDLLRRHTAGPDAHPFAKVALDKLSGYEAKWKEPGGRTPPSRSRSRPPGPRQRRLEAEHDGQPIRLTPREADVLGQLSLGSSYTDIAQDLFISENTVKTHLMSLYRKLRVDKRSAALRVARDAGLI